MTPSEHDPAGTDRTVKRGSRATGEGTTGTSDTDEFGDGVAARRLTAERDDGFVLFVIGMRVNRLWKLHRWLPVALAMPRMLRELAAEPGSGLLGYETTVGWRTVVVLQYWESFDALESFARDPDAEHRPAWRAYTRRVGQGGDVGIFHETYVVEEGSYENVYNNMPPFGLGDVGTRRPAEGERATAEERLGRE